MDLSCEPDLGLSAKEPRSLAIEEEEKENVAGDYKYDRGDAGGGEFAMQLFDAEGVLSSCDAAQETEGDELADADYEKEAELSARAGVGPEYGEAAADECTADHIEDRLRLK